MLENINIEELIDEIMKNEELKRLIMLRLSGLSIEQENNNVPYFEGWSIDTYEKGNNTKAIENYKRVRREERGY